MRRSKTGMLTISMSCLKRKLTKNSPLYYLRQSSKFHTKRIPKEIKIQSCHTKQDWRYQSIEKDCVQMRLGANFEQLTSWCTRPIVPTPALPCNISFFTKHGKKASASVTSPKTRQSVNYNRLFLSRNNSYVFKWNSKIDFPTFNEETIKI